MTIRILFGLMLIINFACNAQNSITTNKIVKAKNNKFGVKSESGTLLIDTIYGGISFLYNGGRKTLPPNNKATNRPIEYYVVGNELNQTAIFDKNGKKIFDFVECFQLEVDEHTKTIVAINKLKDNQLRSTLYEFGGKQIFDTTFENIGYINNSDLIALIVEDGQNDEFYLYNPFTKVKLGPYSHFNIYNEDSSPPLGMEKEDFNKYSSLNLITVRQNLGNEYIWGLIDMKGNELLPVEYTYFRVIGEDMKKNFIDRASKPEGVDFLFYAYLFNDKSKLLFFDKKMEKYICENESRTIVKEKY